jgi:hypothetical protein
MTGAMANREIIYDQILGSPPTPSKKVIGQLRVDGAVL